MKKRKVSVVIDLSEVAVVFDTEESESNKILQLAKQEFVSKLQNLLDENKFPSLSYSIHEGEVLTLQDIKAGMLVYIKDEDLYGIVTKKNKKTVNVYGYSNAGCLPILFSAYPENLERVPSSFDTTSIVSKWEEIDGKPFWEDGSLGFVRISGEVKQAVVVKNKDKFKLIIVGGGTTKPLTEQAINIVFFNTKKEAEGK